MKAGKDNQNPQGDDRESTLPPTPVFATQCADSISPSIFVGALSMRIALSLRQDTFATFTRPYCVRGLHLVEFWSNNHIDDHHSMSEAKAKLAPPTLNSMPILLCVGDGKVLEAFDLSLFRYREQPEYSRSLEPNATPVILASASNFAKKLVSVSGFLDLETAAHHRPSVMCIVGDKFGDVLGWRLESPLPSSTSSTPSTSAWTFTPLFEQRSGWPTPKDFVLQHYGMLTAVYPTSHILTITKSSDRDAGHCDAADIQEVMDEKPKKHQEEESQRRIVTSDRDGHIRVSFFPQSYEIEAFLFHPRQEEQPQAPVTAVAQLFHPSTVRACHVRPCHHLAVHCSSFTLALGDMQGNVSVWQYVPAQSRYVRTFCWSPPRVLHYNEGPCATSPPPLPLATPPPPPGTLGGVLAIEQVGPYAFAVAFQQAPYLLIVPLSWSGFAPVWSTESRESNGEQQRGSGEVEQQMEGKRNGSVCGLETIGLPSPCVGLYRRGLHCTAAHLLNGQILCLESNLPSSSSSSATNSSRGSVASDPVCKESPTSLPDRDLQQLNSPISGSNNNNNSFSPPLVPVVISKLLETKDVFAFPGAAEYEKLVSAWANVGPGRVDRFAHLRKKSNLHSTNHGQSKVDQQGKQQQTSEAKGRESDMDESSSGDDEKADEGEGSAMGGNGASPGSMRRRKE